MRVEIGTRRWQRLGILLVVIGLTMGGAAEELVADASLTLSQEYLSAESDWIKPVVTVDGEETGGVTSATKIYLAGLPLGEWLQAGVLLGFDKADQWQTSAALVKLGSWFWSLGRWGEVEGFVENYLDAKDISTSEMEPHLALSFGAGKLWTVIDPAVRLRFDGREPAAGLLGVVAYRLYPAVSVGVRTVADWNEEDESVILGPSVEVESSSGWYGFALVGSDYHDRAGVTLAMVRLGVAL